MACAWNLFGVLTGIMDVFRGLWVSKYSLRPFRGGTEVVPAGFTLNLFVTSWTADLLVDLTVVDVVVDGDVVVV